MVHGASGVVGQAVVRALVERDEVRATVRRPSSAETLRSMGAKVAVLDPDDGDDLAGILRGVVTLVHLVGGPNQLDDDDVFRANHGSTVTALRAAAAAGVPRFVFVSVPEASTDADDPFIRAKGLAEEAVVRSGLEHAILRCAPVYGLGGIWFTAVVQGAAAEPPVTIGDPSREVAPLFADDLAQVVAAIDGWSPEVAGAWCLEGPDVVRASELAALLRGDATVARHLEGEGPLGELLGVPVSASAAAYLRAAGRARGDDAAEVFGVPRTSLREGLHRVASRAGATDGSALLTSPPANGSPSRGPG